MNIIVLGQQGCGKGTQSGKIARKYDFEHIDMGKTLRAIAKKDTPLGKEIYNIQNVTKTLVPSRILREVLSLKLNSVPREQGIIFDGVPRTIDQTEYIEEAMQEVGRHIDKVIFINVSEEESLKRISKRRVCHDCRKVFILGKDIQNDDVCPKCGGKIFQREDDTLEGIKKRLEIFKTETTPVLNFYRQKGILVEIDGDQTIEKVFEDIIKILEKND
jgi:adenylate kinase